MNIEQELPDLFAELADSHFVETPPAGDVRRTATDPPTRRRGLLLTAAAAAAGSLVLIAGLVVLGSRDSSPSSAPIPPTAAPGTAALTEPTAGDSPRLDLVRIDAHATDAGTTDVTLVFDGDLPREVPEVVEDPAEPRTEGVGYTTQDSNGQSISVCGDTHSFRPPGNQTVDVFVPSEWFDPASSPTPSIEPDPVGTAPAKIIVCEPRAEFVQVSIWGSVSGRLDDVDIRVEGPTIVIEITPEATPVTGEDDATTAGALSFNLDSNPPRSPSVFGYSALTVLDDVALIDEVTEVLGDPDADTGWTPMPALYACTGATDYRSLLWDDLRFVLERRVDSETTILAAWSIGDTTLAFSPPLDVDISQPSGITTEDGIGLGTPADRLDEIEWAQSLREGERFFGLAMIGPVVFQLDATDRVDAMSFERNDC